MSQMSNKERLLRLTEVKDRTGLSRSTIYAYMSQGGFPKSIKLGLRCIGWREADINHWISERITSQSA